MKLTPVGLKNALEDIGHSEKELESKSSKSKARNPFEEENSDLGNNVVQFHLIKTFLSFFLSFKVYLSIILL